MLAYKVNFPSLLIMDEYWPPLRRTRVRGERSITMQIQDQRLVRQPLSLLVIPAICILNIGAKAKRIFNVGTSGVCVLAISNDIARDIGGRNSRQAG